MGLPIMNCNSSRVKILNITAYQSMWEDCSVAQSERAALSFAVSADSMYRIGLHCQHSRRRQLMLQHQAVER